MVFFLGGDLFGLLGIDQRLQRLADQYLVVMFEIRKLFGYMGGQIAGQGKSPECEQVDLVSDLGCVAFVAKGISHFAPSDKVGVRYEVILLIYIGGMPLGKENEYTIVEVKIPLLLMLVVKRYFGGIA